MKNNRGYSEVGASFLFFLFAFGVSLAAQVCIVRSIEAGTIITYNVAGANVKVPQGGIVEMLPSVIIQADVLVAQEVTPLTFQKVVNALRYSGYLYESCFKKRGTFNGRIIGHAVFSKYPILTCEAKKFGGRNGDKGMLQIVTIATPWRRYTLGNYHASPAYAWELWGDILNVYEDLDIIAGDFNIDIWPYCLKYEGGSANPMYHEGDTPIDHVWPRFDEWQAQVMREYTASDHLPVKAWRVE